MILAIPSRKESGFGQYKSIHQPQTEVNRVVLFFYSVILFYVGNRCLKLAILLIGLNIQPALVISESKSRIPGPYGAQPLSPTIP
jgi:hypothetical protein